MRDTSRQTWIDKQTEIGDQSVQLFPRLVYQNPNEYIRGSTLRFMCKLREPELLEPVMVRLMIETCDQPLTSPNLLVSLYL